MKIDSAKIRESVRSAAPAVVSVLLLGTKAVAIDPPAPYGPVPTARQIQWQQREIVGFCHFGVNTYTGHEHGDGSESEKLFDPKDFDAEQIVRADKEGGITELVLTCKHHDGFCLWPSKYTEHSVKNSPWKNGKGDVVKEMAEACRKYGLKFGVYLSPWDRNRADFAKPSYIAYYRDQLRELLTDYGPISEVWFDGASGGDGYYGGAWDERGIDKLTYYDWPDTWSMVRSLQPDACMFSDVGPDIRWVGNEGGTAPETCWATLNPEGYAPGITIPTNGTGDRPGAAWLPAECDVSIRPNWFYRPEDRPKSPRELLDLYYASVGHGATLMLNVPPNRSGLIDESDIESLRGFRRLVDATFKRDLARHAEVTASNTRGDDGRFAPRNVIDGRRDTYWSTDDASAGPELVLAFRHAVTFDVVRLREYLPLGQRVDSFGLDRWEDGHWVEFAKGTGIGNCRLVRGQSVTTTKVRLRVTGPVCPAISEVGLFAEPAQASD